MKNKLSIFDKIKIKKEVIKLVRVHCLPILEENSKLKRQLLEICYNADAKQIEKMQDCNNRFPSECHCAFRCLENSFCNDAEERINKLKNENKKLKSTLEHALLVVNNTNSLVQSRINEVLIND